MGSLEWKPFIKMIVILSMLFCICHGAPGNDAIRLGGFSFKELDQRIPNTCATKEGQGQKWCSTKVDSSGVHVNGEGKYGFCSSDCNPSVSLAAILGGLVF